MEDKLAESSVLKDAKEDDMQQARDTLFTLLLGVVVSGVFFAVLGTLLFTDSRAAFVSGVCLGTATACGIAVHLYKTIEKALDREAESAVSYTRGMALLRMVLMGIPMIIAVLLPEYLHILGVFAGLLALKAGAFLQPGILKLLQKTKKKVRESAE